MRYNWIVAGALVLAPVAAHAQGKGRVERGAPGERGRVVTAIPGAPVTRGVPPVTGNARSAEVNHEQQGERMGEHRGQRDLDNGRSIDRDDRAVLPHRKHGKHHGKTKHNG